MFLAMKSVGHEDSQLDKLCSRTLAFPLRALKRFEKQDVSSFCSHGVGFRYRCVSMHNLQPITEESLDDEIVKQKSIKFNGRILAAAIVYDKGIPCQKRFNMKRHAFDQQGFM